MISNSMFSIYIALEVQWMLIFLLLIMDYAGYTFKGIINYILLNCINSLLLFIGLFNDAPLLFIVGLLMKVGLIPMVIIMLQLYNLMHWSFIQYDTIAKASYLIALMFHWLFLNVLMDWFILIVLINLLAVIAIIKGLMMIKHSNCIELIMG